jgi:hypothetical protein
MDTGRRRRPAFSDAKILAVGPEALEAWSLLTEQGTAVS